MSSSPIISGKMLGGDAIRAITRGVEGTVAVHTAIRIEEHERVSLTDGVKKRVKSAHMRGENRWHIQ